MVPKKSSEIKGPQKETAAAFIERFAAVLKRRRDEYRRRGSREDVTAAQEDEMLLQRLRAEWRQMQPPQPVRYGDYAGVDVEAAGFEMEAR